MKWMDMALVHRFEQLMEQERRSIIAVGTNEGWRSDSFRLRGSGVFTTTTPGRAVHVAGASFATTRQIIFKAYVY